MLDVINLFIFGHSVIITMKVMNRNSSNQKANPALKPKPEINKYYKQTKYNENKLLTERAAISQKVATQLCIKGQGKYVLVYKKFWRGT